jgi:hypothetical protein
MGTLDVDATVVDLMESMGLTSAMVVKPTGFLVNKFRDEEYEIPDTWPGGDVFELVAVHNVHRTT